MEQSNLFCVDHLPDDVKRRLGKYRDLLLKWQKAINLVSRGTLNNIMRRHIEDSLQLIPYIKGKNLIDVGSGGGFPGMVLAMVSQNLEFLSQFDFVESFNVTCVDSDHRKMMFLSEVARQTGTDVKIVNDRIENIHGMFDVVTARGFSELKDLIKITRKFSDYGVFLKGRKIDQEVLEAKSLFNFDYEIFNSVTDESGRIIVVSHIRNV